MTIRQIPAPPFDQNAQTIIQTDEDFLVGLGDDIIDVIGPGVTITLPASPLYGERHRVMASGGAATVDGNGHTITSGGTSVALGQAKDYTFAESNEWIPVVGNDTAGASPGTLIFGVRTLENVLTAQFLQPGYGDGVADVDELDFRIPADAILRNMRVHVRDPGQGVVTIDYRLFVDGVASALAVPLLNTVLDGADLVNAVSVSANQRIGVRAQLNGLFLTSQTRILVSIEQAPA